MFTFNETSFINIPNKKILIFDEETELGFFLLIPHTIELYEIHTVIYLSAFGSSVEIAKQCLVWFFNKHPEIKTLITKVPVNNPLAKRLVLKSKGRLCGLIPNSFKITDTEYVDQELFYYSRENI